MNHLQSSSEPLAQSSEQARALAHSLDYLTEQDLCELCGITPATAKTWRLRHKGPVYSLAGTRPLYPRASVRDFLDSQIRKRTEIGARSIL